MEQQTDPQLYKQVYNLIDAKEITYIHNVIIGLLTGEYFLYLIYLQTECKTLTCSWLELSVVSSAITIRKGVLRFFFKHLESHHFDEFILDMKHSPFSATTGQDLDLPLLSF